MTDINLNTVVLCQAQAQASGGRKKAPTANEGSAEVDEAELGP